MAFGDIVRSAASPVTIPRDIGGDSSIIWHCDAAVTAQVYELSTTDFSVDRQANSPGAAPYGIGGDSSTIWHCDPGTNLIYELSTTDFSVDRSASDPANAQGIGGDSSTIWHTSFISPKNVYELSTIDFSVDRSAASPASKPQGIGGNASTIWHVDQTVTARVYELSTTDFSVDRQANSPDIAPGGIGGDSSTLWHCDYVSDIIYELDAASAVAPTVTTQAVDNIGTTTATGHGNITDTGGENCTKRGVCWNTDGNPTVADSVSEETGSFGTGAFSRAMTGLTPGQHYYVKAYAYNSSGYGYGSQVEFTTIAEKTSSDTGSGTDSKTSLLTTTTKTSSDAGAGSEGAPVPTATLAGSEDGQGLGAISSQLAVITAVETGTSIELEALLKDLFASEAGRGADSFAAKIETPTRGGGMKLWT